MAAEAQALFNAALTKLPQLDLNWPEPVRAGWWRCFNALRDLGEAMGTAGVTPTDTALELPAWWSCTRSCSCGPGECDERDALLKQMRDALGVAGGQQPKEGGA